MRYVERIIVVAGCPVLFFVYDCWRAKCIALYVVAVVVCVNCVYACLGFVVDKPSLQALRAETMVERFTARMHVSRLDVAKQKKLYGTKQPVPWTGNLENHEMFQNIDAGDGLRHLNS